MPLHSDDLFPQTKDAAKGPLQWEALEKRINRLLEGIVQLRNANAQLMKENAFLKKQARDGGAEGGSNGSSPSGDEYQKLKKQYDEAIQDLKAVKQNLQRIETLAADLKLEG